MTRPNKSGLSIGIRIAGTTAWAVCTDDGAGQKDQEAQVAGLCEGEQIKTRPTYPADSDDSAFQRRHFVQR